MTSMMQNNSKETNNNAGSHGGGTGESSQQVKLPSESAAAKTHDAAGTLKSEESYLDAPTGVK